MTDAECSKCSGENRVIVPDNDGHWHWEDCPACNGFEDVVLAESVCFDGWGDAPPFGVGELLPYGGSCKFYLSAADCKRLSEAFAHMADMLKDIR